MRQLSVSDWDGWGGGTPPSQHPVLEKAFVFGISDDDVVKKWNS